MEVYTFIHKYLYVEHEQPQQQGAYVEKMVFFSDRDNWVNIIKLELHNTVHLSNLRVQLYSCTFECCMLFKRPPWSLLIYPRNCVVLNFEFPSEKSF